MHYACILCLLLFCTRWSAALAQPDTLAPKRPKVEKLDHLIMLKLTQSSDVEKIAVITGARDIRLSPNATTVTGLSFSYRFINAGISYVPRFLPGNNDDDLKGKTRSGGFWFSANFRRWINDFSYTRTKGYYLENTRDFDPSWTPGKPYAQIPNLVLTQYQGLTAYNFNPEYSINAVVYQSERQLRSAGSFIPQFRYRYYINDDRSTPLPNGFTQKAKNVELLLGAGYHYSLVMQERVYISLGITPNIGYVFSRISTRYATETLTGDQHNTIFRLDGRVGAGYNGQRFFTGFYMNLAASAFHQQHSSVATENDAAAFRFFIGYRLPAPKWMQQTVQKLGKKIGISYL